MNGNGNEAEKAGVEGAGKTISGPRLVPQCTAINQGLWDNSGMAHGITSIP